MKKAHITCPYCHAPAQLRPASSIYGIHTKDRAAKLYVCSRYPACDAYVAAHKDTLLPMGTLADRNLRRKRMEAHSALNQLIGSGIMTRKQAYRWLQLQLGLPESEAHIAKFSQLGNIAYRTGKKLSWDGTSFHDAEADKYLCKEYRAPWELPKI